MVGRFSAEAREELLLLRVALAYTELPLLVSPSVSPIPLLDSTRLLAAAAVETAVGHRRLPRWRGGLPTGSGGGSGGVSTSVAGPRPDLIG